MAKSKLAGVLDNRIYQLLFLAAVAGICLYTLVFFAIIRPKLALLMNKNNTKSIRISIIDNLYQKVLSIK